MTQDTQREKFEACMRQASRHKPELLSWKDGRYEFDAMQSAFCGFCMGMEAALEAKQSEAKMPEPAAYLYHDAPMLADFITNERTGIPINSALFSVKRHPNYRNETPLYTESQLRTLLAQHGIKIAD